MNDAPQRGIAAFADIDSDDVVVAGKVEIRWYRNEGRMIRVRPAGGRVR